MPPGPGVAGIAAQAAVADGGESNATAPTPTPVVASARDAGKPNARLRATIQWVSTPQRAMRLKNVGSFPFSHCSVVVPGQLEAELKSLSPGFEREFVLSQFTADPRAPNLNNQVRLTCAQGSIFLPAQ